MKRRAINYCTRVTSITWDCTGQTSPGMSCSLPFHVCLSATYFGRPTSSVLQEASLEYFGLLLSELLRHQWASMLEIRRFYVPQVKNHVLLFVVYLFSLLPVRTQPSWAQGLCLPEVLRTLQCPKWRGRKFLLGCWHTFIVTFLYDCD